jgi:hypothetical protein
VSNRRIVVAIILGFCTFIVVIAAGETLGDLPAWVIGGTYLAVCQFFVARKGVGLRANRATLLGMGAPPVLMFSFGTLLLEKRDVFLTQGIPGVLIGCLGPVVGAIAASALPAKASQA